jgi:hypothetical protein
VSGFVPFFIATKNLVFGVARKIQAHNKKVAATRYCKICGRLADFRIRTGFRDMTPLEMSFPLHSVLTDTVSGAGSTDEVPLTLVHNPTFCVCQVHHPDIGKARGETREYLHKIHPKLAVRLIEPTQLL